MRVYLIRHGATRGNREHRYVGSTDEELLPEAAQALQKLKKRLEKKEGQERKILVSPLQRCRQSAQLLFPGEAQTVVNDLRECDFGDFEYKNYEELNGNADYQKFLDSMGEAPFPGGESKRIFSERCERAFREEIRKLLQEEESRKKKGNKADSRKEELEAVFVIHGGTIMAILDCFSDPHRDYYDWQVFNGEGFEARVEEVRGASGIRLREISRL